MNRALPIAVLAAVTALGLVFVTYRGLRDYLRPVFANGDATANRIDHAVGAIIAARFPQVSVGAARCPTLLNLTGQRRGRCTLRVAGADLRIDVAHVSFIIDYDPLEPVDALFITSEAQHSIADALAATYGEVFEVRCPGPAIRILPPATAVTCAVRAPDVPRRDVAVTPVGYAGEVRVGKLRGVTTRMARTFGAAIAAQRTGTIAIPGKAVERYAVLSAALEARGEIGRRRLVGAAHCPPRIVLHERGRAVCTVRIAGRVQRLHVDFDRRVGLNLYLEGEVEIVAVLRRIATRYLERTRSAGDRRARAQVDCGSGVIVFTDSDSPLPCMAAVDGKRVRLTFEIDDAEHIFDINADD